jgi:D-arabinose 1-dehydrogenase-like Zn-dependent alcohol dehydrogenase
MGSKIRTHHTALQLESIEAGLQIKKLPTPQPGLSNAIIRIEATGVLSYHRGVYNGDRHHPCVKGISRES